MIDLRVVGPILIAALLVVAFLQAASARAACTCEHWRIGGSAISFTQSNGQKVRLMLEVRGANLTGSADFDKIRGTVHGQIISGRLEFHVRWNHGRQSQYYLFIDNDGFVLGWGYDRALPGEIVSIRGGRRLDCAADQVLEEAVGPGMENDTNRAFSDYNRFELTGRTPEVCQNACLADRKNCRAWAYVRPGFQGPKALCYLKHSVPTPVPDKCCITGVTPRRAPEQQELERSISP